MLDPTTLFSYEKHVDPRVLTGTTLVVTIGSFSDAGHMQQLTDEHVLNTLPSRIIGRLDLDQIFDYGAHRPEVTLHHDRFADYDTPEMLLHEVTSADGEPFYLLTGPEPTMQWERVASALRIVVEQLGVERIIMATSFPALVPHTRPLTVTRFAADPADIRSPRPMPAVIRLRSSFGALLTIRLGEAGHHVIGTVTHVPQYLADAGLPQAVIASLEALHREGGPEISPGKLVDAAAELRKGIDEQVAGAPPLQEMIRALEENYDRNLLTATADTEVPSGEEIAAEVERFLQEMGDGGASETDADHTDADGRSGGDRGDVGTTDGPTEGPREGS